VHRILIGLFVAFMALPASAQSSNRNWVKAGTEGSFVICVDQNSISKRADGLTQFVSLVFCRGPEAAMRVEAVKCEQDMSGQYFPMLGRPFPPDDNGSYEFGTTNTKSCSLSGQAAKFVCNKPGPYKSCKD